MQKTWYRLTIAALAISMMAGAVSWASAKTDHKAESDRRKAEYLFLEAQNAYSMKQWDKYIALMDRAYKLDTADIDIAGEWAMITFLTHDNDSARIEKSLRLLKQQYFAKPENYITGEMLAGVLNNHYLFRDALKVWQSLDSIYPTRPQVSQNLALAYLRAYATGDSTAYDKAIEIYDRIEEGSGRNIDLSTMKINAYYLKNDTLAVLNELDSLYASSPNDSFTSLYIGVNYQYIDMPDMALKYYDRACELDSTNGMAYLQRAKFYNAQGDSLNFDREVFHALKSQNLDIDSKTSILRSYVSELYTDSLQEPRIRQLFDELALMHPGEGEIHKMYGSYLYERADLKKAAEEFSYAAALTPGDVTAWLSYVQAAAAAEDTTMLRSGAEEAIKRFPDNYFFPIVLSNSYMLDKEYDKAIEVLDNVDLSIATNKGAASALLTSKGDVYSQAGDTIKAIETYEEAISLQPDNSMALNNAAYFMALINLDLDKAERYSAKSLQGDELNTTYLDTYAWVFFKKKDYKMARHYIDIALNGLDLEDHDEKVYEVVEDEDGNLEPEIDVVNDEEAEIQQLIAPSADILDHAGDIYFMNGEHEKALEFWKKAHELDPDDEIITKKVTHKTIFMR